MVCTVYPLRIASKVPLKRLQQLCKLHPRVSVPSTYACRQFQMGDCIDIRQEQQYP
jgi:hypothetical protein